MRPISLACLLALLAACECGAYPASGDRGRDDDVPPGEVTCAGMPDAPPVDLHELAAGETVHFAFSPCGHLLAVVDGAELLAPPDLAALAPLPAPEGWSARRRTFSPTGELLLRSGDGGSRLLDLATGTETALPPADDLGFFPSRDLDRSILGRCTEDGLVAVDLGTERPLDPGVRCLPYPSRAALAPVVLATSAAERLLVADLERGAVLDTGLPLVESEDELPTPSGRRGYRLDEAFLSPDGGRVLHIQRWWVFEGDTIEYEGTGEVHVVETATGAVETYPGNADGPLGIFRTGFLWGHGGAQTRFAGADGDGELDFWCNDVEPYWGTGELVLLSCFHESGSARWHDHVFDARTRAAVDLGRTWSVRQPSRNVRAVAGCPRDDWRVPSCTVPVVRRWMEGDEVRDLPLDRTADVVWVGDDGAVLAIATGRDEGILLAPSGAVTVRFPLRSPAGDSDLPRIEEAAGVLLVRAESLELLVPETGRHLRLAETHAGAALDPRGQRLAFTVPDGDGYRLMAGAVPR